MTTVKTRARRRPALPCSAVLGTACLLACGVTKVYAFGIDTGNRDLKWRWDTTAKYSAAFRVKDRSAALLADPNFDDADRNFSRGLISNRVDLLSEMDLHYQGMGLRVSGAGWYDSVYNRSNDNDSPGTVNQASRPYNEFATGTRNLHGRKGELLDAFVFGKGSIGDMDGMFRLGRHALLYGESLFFGANGIAGGQSAVDIVKAVSVPNTQFKELVRPIEQISGQLQISSRLSVGAYYQWRWEANRLPGSGSYFSNTDFIGDGADRLLLGPVAANRGPDMKARNNGQGGAQVRFRIGETDYGLYAVRFHDKSPQLYFNNVNPASVPFDQFRWVYPEGITAYGASFSRTLGEVNVAGEASIRHNQPLASDAQFDPFGTAPPGFGPAAAADNRGNSLYAVGKTAHAQVSWLASLGPNFLAEETSFVGEVAWNRTLSITRNAAALNPNADRDAVNVRMVFEPQYRQALPGVDLSVPVGLGFGKGNSSALGAAFMGDNVGDMSIGLSGSYLQVWRFGLNYTHFFGPEGLAAINNHSSFKQSSKDRDFISLSFSRTF